MIVKTFRYLLLILVMFSFVSVGIAFADDDPSDPITECKNARTAGLKCKVCGDCAVILTTVGTRLCKTWNGFEFKTVDCNSCSDSECANADGGFE